MHLDFAKLERLEHKLINLRPGEHLSKKEQAFFVDLLHGPQNEMETSPNRVEELKPYIECCQTEACWVWSSWLFGEVEAEQLWCPSCDVVYEMGPSDPHCIFCGETLILDAHR